MSKTVEKTKSPDTQNYFAYETAFGKILVVSDGSAITALYVKDMAIPNGRNEADALTDRVAEQLEEYFSGKRKEFDIPLHPQGTDFQRSVWKELQRIPYGETISYKQMAINIGNPKACRAVGLANNKNPISIIIPCHRVIGSNGALVGYGGGLDMKRKLLDLEKKHFLSP